MSDKCNIDARLDRVGVVGAKRAELSRILFAGPCSPYDDELLAEFRDSEQAARHRRRMAREQEKRSQILSILVLVTFFALLALLPVLLDGIIAD